MHTIWFFVLLPIWFFVCRCIQRKGIGCCTRDWMILFLFHTIGRWEQGFSLCVRRQARNMTLWSLRSLIGTMNGLIHCMCLFRVLEGLMLLMTSHGSMLMKPPVHDKRCRVVIFLGELLLLNIIVVQEMFLFLLLKMEKRKMKLKTHMMMRKWASVKKMAMFLLLKKTRLLILMSLMMDFECWNRDLHSCWWILLCPAPLLYFCVVLHSCCMALV